MIRESSAAIKPVLEKYLVLLVKVLNDILDNHPFTFIPLICPTLDLVSQFAFMNSQLSALNKLIILSLNIIKGIVLCPEYRPAKVIQGKVLRIPHRSA